MLNERRIQLQRIINDSASTAEEVTEARRQVQESDIASQSDQDKLITRYLAGEVESGYCGMPDATIGILHGLTYWPLGLVSDQMRIYVDALVALHGRTLDTAIQAGCTLAIENWLKLAQRYQEIPGAEKVIRHAAKFFDANPAST